MDIIGVRREWTIENTASSREASRKILKKKQAAFQKIWKASEQKKSPAAMFYTMITCISIQQNWTKDRKSTKKRGFEYEARQKLHLNLIK